MAKMDYVLAAAWQRSITDRIHMHTHFLFYDGGDFPSNSILLEFSIPYPFHDFFFFVQVIILWR